MLNNVFKYLKLQGTEDKTGMTFWFINSARFKIW